MVPIKTNSHGRAKIFGSMFIKTTTPKANQSLYESKYFFNDNKLIYVYYKKKFLRKAHEEENQES